MAKQNESAAAVLRKLPTVNTLLKEPGLDNSAAELGRTVVVNSIRRAIEEVRELLMAQALAETDEDSIRRKIIADVRHRLKTITRPHYRRVINATGIILHTALGRAVLSAQALRQIQDELSGYSLLQANLETGKRSQRDEHIGQLLQQLTGAEAATVGSARRNRGLIPPAGCDGLQRRQTR
jgi:L-seryl-tRNA(Ser) seleniumtransferase